MKNQIINVLAFLSICLTTNAQRFEWSRTCGESFTDDGRSISTDNFGNIIITGNFLNTIDIDPGPSIFNLVSNGGYEVFIQKLDNSGNLLWAKSLGGTGNDQGSDMTTDQFGNIYMTGGFQGTVDFDLGPNTVNLTSNGNGDVFVLKLDVSGNYLWAKSFGGPGSDSGSSINVDSSGNVFTTGAFSDTMDFNPGSNSTILSPFGNSDVFVQKLDSSGNFLWARSFGGTNDDSGQSSALDHSGNVYTTGIYVGTADFDPDSAVTNTLSGTGKTIFVQKMDTSGNFLWAKSFGGLYDDMGLGIALDNLNNVYTTGNFIGNVDFDPGPSNYYLAANSSGQDSFVQKMDANGNFIWAKSFGGPTSSDRGVDITIDALNNVYTIGSFTTLPLYGPTDFDPGPAIMNLSSVGGKDVFIQKLDSDGNFLWAKSFGGTNTDFGASIAVDTSFNVYTTGYFQNTVDFDTGAGTYNQTSVGGYDIFVHKISSCTITTGKDSVVACNEYTWIDGVTYTADNNIATYVLTNSTGCDSVITLDLTINYSTSATDVQTACDSYTWIDGNIYSSSNNTASLFYTNAVGCDSVVMLDLTINGGNNSGYSYIDNGNGNYSFTNTSAGNFNQSHWAFGDGSNSNVESPIHTFNTNGTFIVILTVNDSISVAPCFDYFIDTITVAGVPVPLQCNAGYVIIPDTVGNNITIINSSTGTNLNYLWDFGDGNTSILQNPSHTYSSAGPFNLCLTVNDSLGCNSVFCDSIGSFGVWFKQSGFSINVITPLISVSVDDQMIINSELEIYPNPASQQLSIAINEFNIYEIEIINITGEIVKSFNYKSNLININDLSAGTYFLKILTNKETIIKKFIKE